MARRRPDPKLDAGGRDHVALAQPFGSELVRRVERADRRAGEFMHPRRTVAVIEMAMSEQDRAHVACHRQNCLQVRLVLRAGIDDDRSFVARSAQHPGVRALQGHRARIVGEHDRSERRHLPQLLVGGVSHVNIVRGSEIDVPSGSSATTLPSGVIRILG